MRLIVLGSGSSGNALFIEAGETGVLVDVGLSAKETARRMSEAGIDPARLSGIVVTHEHADHVKGVRVMSKTISAPVFISQATREECHFPAAGDGIHWGEAISSSQDFQIGSLEFHPFTIPHDGIDTFAFTVQAEGIKVGIVTDLGYRTLARLRLRDDRSQPRPRHAESRAVSLAAQAAYRQQHRPPVERRDGALDERRF